MNPYVYSSRGNHLTKTINMYVGVDVDQEGVVVAVEVEDSDINNITCMERHQRQSWAAVHVGIHSPTTYSTLPTGQ